MKNSKITLTSLIILGLFFSLNFGCQSELDEPIVLTSQEEILSADLRSGNTYYIDLTTQNGHGLVSAAPSGCVGCHQGSNRLVFQPSKNGAGLVPHDIMISYYEDYVSTHTPESAGLNGINLAGVSAYIANHR